MLHVLEEVEARNRALAARFAEKLRMNQRLKRSLVSFQANKARPGSRWFKYKEGFSEALIHYLLDTIGLTQGRVLDPFAGVGTTLFVAHERGLDSVGIEVLPVGGEVMEIRKMILSGEVEPLKQGLERWLDTRPWLEPIEGKSFPHLQITDGAFPPSTQQQLDSYLTALSREPDPLARLLRLAAMCVLEEVSYTRKDGQYLRWDYRSGRRQGSKPFNKGNIKNFDVAIYQKLEEICNDLQPLGELPGMFPRPDRKGVIDVIQGSSLDVLPTLPGAAFDALITSPPYCNRYDYTRTYALELAMLGIGEAAIRALRQAMLSCTVENRDKTSLQAVFPVTSYQRATEVFSAQQELQAILDYLEQQKQRKTLNNPGIVRMVRNYFYEMALVIVECARVLKPGAPLVMVNDNVRYGGATIPVDLILSDMAQQLGFEVETIWVLPTGKGNSSQQMGRHGREELRKCVYLWRRRAEDIIEDESVRTVFFDTLGI